MNSIVLEYFVTTAGGIPSVGAGWKLLVEMLQKEGLGAGSRKDLIRANLGWATALPAKAAKKKRDLYCDTAFPIESPVTKHERSR